MIDRFSTSCQELGCVCNVILSFVLVLVFIGSLYIGTNDLPRNHPTIIKKRMFTVFGMSFVSAFVVYVFADASYLKNSDFWSLTGVRLSGIVQAIILPLLLTMVLFLGPICLHYQDRVHQTYFDLKFWSDGITDIMWLRNHVIAPVFEEFTFRACLIPLLVSCLKYYQMMLYCSLLFGMAHLHLVFDELARGSKLQSVVFSAILFVTYTTVFGAYSTYLFTQTGHVAAPIVAHMYCNLMGLPNFERLLQLKQPTKSIMIACFAMGLLLWSLMLKFTMNPYFYNNITYLQIATT